MANPHCVSSKQLTAGSAETSNAISDYAALSATCNLYDLYEVLDL